MNSGLLWLLNKDLNKTHQARQPVDIHLLQEGLLHRSHRIAEEFAIVEQIERHFVPRNASVGSLLGDIQTLNITATFRDDGHNIYHYARETEVKELAKLQVELKALQSAGTPPGDARLVKAEASIARHKLTIDTLFKKRVYASMAALMLYN